MKICNQCFYQLCESCNDLDNCMCNHWWSGIGARRAKIQAEEHAKRQKEAISNGNPRASMWTSGGQHESTDLSATPIAGT